MKRIRLFVIAADRKIQNGCVLVGLVQPAGRKAEHRMDMYSIKSLPYDMAASDGLVVSPASDQCRVVAKPSRLITCSRRRASWSESVIGGSVDIGDCLRGHVPGFPSVLPNVLSF